MKKRTTNQLGLAPMRIPNTRASWIEPAPTGTSSHAPVAGAPRAVRRRASAPAGRRVAGDDGGRVGAGRQRAVRETGGARGARGAERGGGGGGGGGGGARGPGPERGGLPEPPGAGAPGAGGGARRPPRR